MKRCGWVNPDVEQYVKYHDEEWGVPVHDDVRLFEMLVLEGAQAGLSWRTVLSKRARYREVFDQFDPVKVAAYDEAKVASLLADPGIVRNRLKVSAAIRNAGVFLEMQREFGSFNRYLWDFVGGKPIVNRWESWRQLPSKSDLSDRIAKDLKKRGMSFVGSTTIYAFLQAVGVVNDHEVGCFRYREVGAPESERERR